MDINAITPMARADIAEIDASIHNTHIAFEQGRIKRSLMTAVGRAVGHDTAGKQTYSRPAICGLLDDAITQPDNCELTRAFVDLALAYARNDSDAAIGQAARHALDWAVLHQTVVNVEALDQGEQPSKMFVDGGAA